MKRNIITALLITAMISMTACGNKNTDTTTETVATTETAVTATEETATTEVATQDQIATLPMTDEEKPVVDATPSPDAKSTDAPKTTEDPKSTAKPVVTATAKPNTQASATTTATTKPNATAKPSATTAPKSTTAPTTAPKATTAPAATATPKATQAPAATAKPAANTPAPTAAPVACQHTSVHIENSHDTENVPISGGCYDVYNYSTKVCNDCGYSFGETRNYVNTVHQGRIISEGVSATCTTDGYSQVCGCDCGGSGTTGGDVIPAYGHDYVDEFDHEETDAEGKDHVYFHSICRNCGDISSTWEE